MLIPRLLIRLFQIPGSPWRPPSLRHQEEQALPRQAVLALQRQDERDLPHQSVRPLLRQENELFRVNHNDYALIIELDLFSSVKHNFLSTLP